jgi:putative two-component system response regulator
VTTVDVFDAMHSERPYKKAMPLEDCFRAIREGSGVRFDPGVVKVFLENADEITAIFHKWRDDS